MRSFHLQMVSSKVESQRDLGRALALEPRRREGRSIPRNCHHPQSLMYADHVRYADQLRRFEEHFPREQMLVLIYDDFRADNDATVRAVLDFLGLPADGEATLTAELKRRFKPEVEAVSEHLGRDLVALWGYDEIV